MTQTQKIRGKFYPLQHEEWLRACRELTPAQRDVLYFIRTLDPHNNGIDLNCAEIARQLSGSKKVHRETISRAIKVLEEKGFIDTEILAVRVKVRPKGLLCQRDQEITHRDQEITHRDQEITHRDQEITHDTTRSRTVITTHHTEAETPTQQTSEDSKIYKTYKDFLDSLSDSEREKFLLFGKKKAEQLPKPPTLIERWIEKNATELIEQFRAEQGEAAAPSQDWANHPKREEWITEIRMGKPRFIMIGDPSVSQETRRAFANWAIAKGLVWREDETI